MRLQVLSDLHLDSQFSLPVEPTGGKDLMILAGDICDTSRAPKALRKYLSKTTGPVDIIMGNHDYYGHSTMDLELLRPSYELDPRIKLRDDQVVDYGPVGIIYSTLWSDLNWDQSRHPRDFVDKAATSALSDFIRIGDGLGGRMLPEHMRLAHSIAVAKITKGIAALREQNKKVVVVTHFSPTLRSCHPRWAQHWLNAYFHNRLDHVVASADLWIHGHTHDCCDYMLGGCRVVCNPRGYSFEDKKDYNSSLVVEI